MLVQTMKYGVVTMVGFVLLTRSLGADGQIIGEDMCACSPSTYEFTLDFDLSCPPMNITESNAIGETSCVTTPFGDPNTADLVPVAVQSIDILELGPGLGVLVQENIAGIFLSGDSFVYTSIAAPQADIESPVEIPRAIQVNIVGLNQFNEALINVYIITFTNDCNAFPLLSEGQSAGWTYFTRLGAPGRDLCPIGNPDTTTGSPTPEIVSAEPAQSNTFAPTVSPPTVTSRAPISTVSPTVGSTSTPSAPVGGGTPAPVVTIVPTPSNVPPKTVAPTHSPVHTWPPTVINPSTEMSMFMGLSNRDLLEELDRFDLKVGSFHDIIARGMWLASHGSSCLSLM